tara:strand:- start:308 stop:697 length:390 start_codon:yes stop_codon:yes gene_type:complete
MRSFGIAIKLLGTAILTALVAGCAIAPQSPADTHEMALDTRGNEVLHLGGLARIEAENPEMIARLIQDYAENPLESGSNRIRFHAALFDEINAVEYYVFDIDFRNDVYLVYLVDGREAVLNRYIYSTWQ